MSGVFEILRGGRGSIVRKTPDTALYFMCVSTLWFKNSIQKHQVWRTLKIMPRNLKEIVRS